jgi:hypothetical protein
LDFATNPDVIRETGTIEFSGEFGEQVTIGGGENTNTQFEIVHPTLPQLILTNNAVGGSPNYTNISFRVGTDSTMYIGGTNVDTIVLGDNSEMNLKIPSGVLFLDPLDTFPPEMDNALFYSNSDNSLYFDFEKVLTGATDSHIPPITFGDTNDPTAHIVINSDHDIRPQLALKSEADASVIISTF